MGFLRRYHCWAVVLLCVGACAQTATVAAEVRVLVYDNERVPSGVLEQAGAEAARIFRQAGIRLLWTNCSGREARHECRLGPNGSDIVVHVIAHGTTANDSIFGEAYLSAEGEGKYADVFLDRIEDAHRGAGTSPSTLLGAVAAHEIGHLLLGLHAHTWVGIMAPTWSSQDLRQMGMGSLLFTREEGNRMKVRLGQEHPGNALEASRSGN